MGPESLRGLAYGMGRGTYGGVEVTQVLTGEPTPTMPHLYSGTQQLRLLRMMFLREEGNRLLIGHGMPKAWLERGKRIEVRDAATRFGPVSYSVEVDGDGRGMLVVIEGVRRTPPEAIEIKLRHPGGRAIRSVRVNGQPSRDFTGDTIVLRAVGGTMRIAVEY